MPQAPAHPRRRLRPVLVMATAVALFDLATKAWAESALAGQAPVNVLGRWLRLELSVNQGVAFGLLPGRWGSVLLGGLVLVALLALSFRARPAGRAYPLGLGLMLGGTAANTYDRAFGDVAPHGLWGDGPTPGVVDFIAVQPWPGRSWPAFNLADVAIVVGAMVLLLALWRGAGG